MWPPPPGSLVYLYGSPAAGYSRKSVWREGTDCAGLINWARAECGLEPIGGTKPDREWIGMTGSWALRSWPVRSRRCARDASAQGGHRGGHIVMISTPDQYVIQVDASRGVNEYGRAWEARSWAGFTHYGLMPDADYSETPEAVQP